MQFFHTNYSYHTTHPSNHRDKSKLTDVETTIKHRKLVNQFGDTLTSGRQCA